MHLLPHSAPEFLSVRTCWTWTRLLKRKWGQYLLVNSFTFESTNSWRWIILALVGFVVSLWWVLSRDSPFKIAHTCLSPRLYGTTLSQTIFYIRSFPGDDKATQYLVSGYTPLDVWARPTDRDLNRFISFGSVLHFQDQRSSDRFLMSVSWIRSISVFLPTCAGISWWSDHSLVSVCY
jgi:hypothetical protein